MRSTSKKRVNQALRNVAAQQAQYQMAMIQTPEPRLSQSQIIQMGGSKMSPIKVQKMTEKRLTAKKLR